MAFPDYGPLPFYAAAPKKKKAAFDWQAALRGWPGLQQTLDAINASGVQQQADLTGARQRALIQYGDLGAPALAGQLGADITQGTRDLAAQNTQAGLSTAAQLQRGYERQQSADVGSLAGRGLIRSGAYRQHSLENLQGLQLGQSQAQQQVLDTLAQLQRGYQTDQQGLAQQAATATNEALQGVLGGIGAGVYGGTPSASAAPAPVTSNPNARTIPAPRPAAPYSPPSFGRPRPPADPRVYRPRPAAPSRPRPLY